jgi:hypothetical protein
MSQNGVKKWHNLPPQSLMHCLNWPTGLTWHLTQHNGQGLNHYSLAHFARKELRSQNVLHSWSWSHTTRNTLYPPCYSNHHTFPIITASLVLKFLRWSLYTSTCLVCTRKKEFFRVSLYQSRRGMYKREVSKCFSCCVFHVDNCVDSGGAITEHDQNLRFASSH